MAKKSKFGPGFLVAAAFIGPGTVTTATLAGAGYGYALIWVIVIATLSAILLQEMAGRFSLATGIDVAAALVKLTRHRWLKRGFQVLAFLAIIVGCAAYEAGNILGGTLGLEILTGITDFWWVLLISAAAIFLLWWRNYKLIERFLITLVVIMGLSFFISAVIVKPDLSGILKGFVPVFPKKSMLLILGLLGTTIVPYNIFLHSSVILKKWQGEKDIPLMRTDTALSIGLGGIITLSIIVTAAAAYFGEGLLIKSPADLSLQLTPLYGKLAKLFFGIGLFSAGLSSAITAPYAAAWTASGLFGWKEKSWTFRSVFLFVISFGAVVSLLAVKPLKMIVVAQVTNAVLLPIVALFIVYLLNKKEPGKYKNTLLQNILFAVVFIIIVLINLKKFI
ncbi:MAG: Nramp family divalent metal transporter [Candidatus Aminicenantes bacterium]|nr:Nramp family divalent metal transporter [Candidatus Aminicenantes bacterium]